MNLQHLYTELLKHHLSGKGRICIGEWDERYYIITYDSYSAFVCPRKHFPFDIPELTQGNGVSEKFARIFKHNSDAPHAKLTDDLKIMDKCTVRRITDGTTDVWVNERFLKPYKPTSFVILGPTSPVAIYEGDDFVGAVLPVRMPTV